MISQISMTCVHKAWNLKYDTTKMAPGTNEDCIGWLLWKLLFDGGGNETFDIKRFKSIKEDFSDGESK